MLDGIVDGTVRDYGLLHALLKLVTQRGIEGHPKLGASWEDGAGFYRHA